MRVLKKTVAMRKKQIRNLYEVVGSWRTLAKEYFGNEIKHGTLQRFATDKNYIPADERLLRLLDLVEPPNPYRVLPRWYKRIPEALRYFDFVRSRTSELSTETRRSFRRKIGS